MASARVGNLVTFPRHVPGRRTTIVTLEDDEEGRPVLRLTPDSPAVADLIARPIATVHVSPTVHQTVLVSGGAQRLRSRQGLLRFRVEAGAVRLAGRLVPVEQYRTASPDPLRHEAPAVLRHLFQRHRGELMACLRVHGHDALWVEPRGLDRYGLKILSVNHQGVELVRLPFAPPVARLQELPASHATSLLCRCRDDADPPPST